MSDKPQAKDWYEHEYSPSIFIMFTKDHDIIWSYSGNNLRDFYLKNPSGYISEPIEVAIPLYLDKKLTDKLENF